MWSEVGTQTAKPAVVPVPAKLYLHRYLALELREMCRARSLPVTGLRDDLARRVASSPVRVVRRASCARAMAASGSYRKADHRILHDEAAMTAWINLATGS